MRYTLTGAGLGSPLRSNAKLPSGPTLVRVARSSAATEARVPFERAGTRTIVGRLRVDTAPGEGVVFQVVGRVLFEADGSIFTAGQHVDPPPGSGLVRQLMPGAATSPARERS